MPSNTWQEGDIAYLQLHELFNDSDYYELIESGTMPPGATGHPCVILKVLPGARVVITTVSAYGSGAYNNNRAPWIAMRCYSKDQLFFRSFRGSICSSRKNKPLQLIPGQQMPKPETSWLHIKNVYSVPLSVISRFTKPRNGQLLKMAPSSLADLRSDIAKRSPYYNPDWQLVDTPSSIKRGSTTTTQRQPRALPEPPAVTSTTYKRPTVIPITPPKQPQCSPGTGPMLQSQPPNTTPASSTQAAAQPKQISWATVASKAVAPKPTGSIALHRSTSKVNRISMVKACA
jgi:hypothetical protein